MGGTPVPWRSPGRVRGGGFPRGLLRGLGLSPPSGGGGGGGGGGGASCGIMSEALDGTGPMRFERGGGAGMRKGGGGGGGPSALPLA